MRRWNAADRKQAVIDELEEHGVVLENLATEVGKDLDPFDLILHVAWDQRPLTRKEPRAVLEALLEKYQDEGVVDLGDPNVLRIAPFDRLGTPVQLVKEFGTKADFENAVHELQSALYQDTG